MYANCGRQPLTCSMLAKFVPQADIRPPPPLKILKMSDKKCCNVQIRVDDPASGLLDYPVWPNQMFRKRISNYPMSKTLTRRFRQLLKIKYKYKIVNSAGIMTDIMVLVCLSNFAINSPVNRIVHYHSCHIFFSAISEIDENFKGVLVKIREVLRNQLFRD